VSAGDEGGKGERISGLLRGGVGWAEERSGGGGGSELTRKRHDGGGPMLKNHQLGPPPLKVEGQGGPIWMIHCRSERIDLNHSDLCAP
jgi:hypothetical protein